MRSETKTNNAWFLTPNSQRWHSPRSRPGAKADHISGRLIVRRVRRLNPKSVSDGQGRLFPGNRHHSGFTNSPGTMLQAETSHRAHAIVEQVICRPEGPGSYSSTHKLVFR
jgi:hypothetical protein